MGSSLQNQNMIATNLCSFQYCTMVRGPPLPSSSSSSPSPAPFTLTWTTSYSTGCGPFRVCSSASFCSNERTVHVAMAKPERRHTVTMIPGDGIGPELMYHVKEVFQSCGAPIDWDELVLSEVGYTKSNTIEEVAASILKNGVCLKGALPLEFKDRDGELVTLNTKLRRRLDIFASVANIRSLEGFKTRHSNVDFAIIRETTEGEYSAIEYETVPGMVESLKIVTRDKSMRIAKFAFDYAIRMKRHKVTAVHKANVMKLSDGLFLECCTEISKLYPRIQFNNMIIDDACMQLVNNPDQFEVIVTSPSCGSMVESWMVATAWDIGAIAQESHSDGAVIFEPGARHSYAEAVGKNIANPTGMLLAACSLLKHLYLHDHANAVEKILLAEMEQGWKRLLVKTAGCVIRRDFFEDLSDRVVKNLAVLELAEADLEEGLLQAISAAWIRWSAGKPSQIPWNYRARLIELALESPKFGITCTERAVIGDIKKRILAYKNEGVEGSHEFIENYHGVPVRGEEEEQIFECFSRLMSLTGKNVPPFRQ